MDTDRMAALEQRVALLESELVTLRRHRPQRPAPTADEWAAAGGYADAPTRVAAAVNPIAADGPRRAPQRPGASTQTTAFALAGGALLIAGCVFGLVLAINRGWIGPSVQLALAEIGGVLLMAAGVVAFSRSGRSARVSERFVSAILIGAGAGIADLGVVAGAEWYEPRLLGRSLAMTLAGIIAVAVCVMAIRLHAQVLCGYALVTALLAPVVVVREVNASSVAFLSIALVASTLVVVMRSWPWLSQVALILSWPQVAVYLLDVPAPTSTSGLARVGLVIAGWWLLMSTAAVGRDVRFGGRLRASSAIGSFSAAFAACGLVAAVGLDADGVSHRQAAAVILALAVTHVACGAGLLRTRPAAPAFAVWACAIGAALAAVGAALVFHGPVLLVGWSVEAVMLVWLAHRFRDRHAAACAALFAVAVAAMTIRLAPPSGLIHHAASLPHAATAGVTASLAVAAAAWILRQRQPLSRLVALAAASVAGYVGSIMIVGLLSPADAGASGRIEQTAQLVLSGGWALLGLALIGYAVTRRSRQARLVGIGLFALVALKVVAFDMSSLNSGYRVGALLLAGLVLLAGAFLLARLDDEPSAPAAGEDVGAVSG